jgi:hypothetical protein
MTYALVELVILLVAPVSFIQTAVMWSQYLHLVNHQGDMMRYTAKLDHVLHEF